MQQEHTLKMEETENAEVCQINLFSRTARLTDEDSQTIAVENASLLYFLFLQCHCNMDYIKGFRHIFSPMINLFQSMRGEKAISMVGSTAEGLYIPGSSDVDFMQSKNSEICCDVDCIEDINHDNYSKVLIAHRQHASPGYTLVLDLNDYFLNDVSRRKTHEQLKTEINKLVADRKVQTIAVSSQDYITDVSFKDVPKHGPAYWLKSSEMMPNVLAFNLLNISLETDVAFSISFRCNGILRNWLNRKRTQGWPSEELKRQISEVQGHVVPVGRKGSRFEEYEWRICYTQAEIKLVHSLNEVQLILYFKLKVFSKAVLKDACSDITSYIIKNVIFWLAESVPNKYFQCRYFIPRFRATLVCLRKCVRKRYLPNYMIPKRNLFAGKLEGQEQAALLDVLSNWIEKCPILEEEKDILPLYKDVVSRKTDKYIDNKVAIIQCLKITASLFSNMLHGLPESGNSEAIHAYILRLTSLTDTELCDIQNIVKTNPTNPTVGIDAWYCTKLYRFLIAMQKFFWHYAPRKTKNR
ncbi:uncharacterized protein LOC128547366 [Mercenaria mercenaria]|uniref:uncharacterized protein LOC128547366 n=1 Tax=Mercenaria mercenaria TaxID=6596 RepID=UPI00234F013E|nr:uncharacterized protein LOC128547366 [Mercenaria mercenaria]